MKIKRTTKIETPSLHNTNDNILCPVKAAARIITRLLSYKYTSDNTQINCYKSGKIFTATSSTNAIKALRKEVEKEDPANYISLPMRLTLI